MGLTTCEAFSVFIAVAIVATVFLIATIGISSEDSYLRTLRLADALPDEFPASILENCPAAYKNNNCAVKNLSVMNGLDFVQYFTDFKMADGSYNESKTGKLGNPDIKTDFNGYSFNFLSEENKKQFEENPSRFIPQFGGFCSWAVSGNFDPLTYSWAANCLGPTGDKALWTILDQKLYFLRFKASKEQFLEDSKVYVSLGDARWQNWFGDKKDEYFDTKCSALAAWFKSSMYMQQISTQRNIIY